MIGGTDVLLPCPIDAEDALRLATRVVRQAWPAAVMENANTGDLLQEPHGLDQVMLYKDVKARDSWEQLGADESNANTMIYVLVGPVQLTLVVDDAKTPEMSRIITAIRKTLLAEGRKRA